MEEGGDIMVKKKQVATTVSIALICFLIGTIVNVNLMTNAKQDDDDKRGIPFIWDAIYGLQAEVESLNVTAQSPKMIRFYNGSELEIPVGPDKERVEFVWYPEDVNNNALVSVTSYMQYYKNTTSYKTFYYKAYVYDSRGNVYVHQSQTYVCQYEVWNWTYTWSGYIDEYLEPNQPYYTICIEPQDTPNVGGYIKDINVVITVIDGLS